MADSGEATVKTGARVSARDLRPARRPPLPKVLGVLRKTYGKPRAAAKTDPFALILYENVAYLASDTRRDDAFTLLKKRTGLSPERILAAPRAVLLEVARFGITPDRTVDKLREIAATALEEFQGDLAAVLRRPLPAAKKALKKFPSIGDPGAEKILLFSKTHPILALDSNGLRVLLRIGFGKEEKSYAKSYRFAQEAADSEIERNCDWLIEAHQLLRRHGQELCKRSAPCCGVCPLQASCAYALRSSAGR
jgi:endonuclease III